MTSRLILIPLLTLMIAASAVSAWAQDKGTVNPKPLPPLANPNDPNTPAKELFGRKVLPAAMPTRVLGFYAHGCHATAIGATPIWWRWSGAWRRRRTGMRAGPEYWSATCRSRAAGRC